MLTKKIAMCVVAMLVCVLGAASHASYITVIDSPFDEFGGDDLFRGFYVENYGADNLSQVILQYSTRDTGVYDTSLTVRIGSYEGTIVGETKYLSTPLQADIAQQVVYDFGGAPVPEGSLLTFTQVKIDGPGFLYYDVGLSSHPQITQTENTYPPLDEYRRDQVGVTITAIPEPATLLMLTMGTIPVAIRCRKPKH